VPERSSVEVTVVAASIDTVDHNVTRYALVPLDD
jgi:hypothetical protein